MLEAFPLYVGGDEGGDSQGSAQYVHAVLDRPYLLAVKGIQPLASIRDVVYRELRLRVPWCKIQEASPV